MKYLLPGLVALSLLAACGVTPQTDLTDWQFSKDGDQWEAVTVPHSYNAHPEVLPWQGPLPPGSLLPLREERLPALRGRGPGGGSVPGRHAPEGP